MDNKILMAGVVAVVVMAGAGFLLLNQPSGQAPAVQEQAAAAEQQAAEAQEESLAPAPETTASAEEAPAQTAPAQAEEGTGPAAHVVEMSSDGFSPSPLTIKAGDTVEFRQVDGSERWPASAFHPTHTAYPGSDINKCGSGEQIFDACGAVKEGKSWSFTFGEKGAWNYHDHLNSGKFGTIVVE